MANEARPHGGGDTHSSMTALERAAEKGHTAAVRLLSNRVTMEPHNSDPDALKLAAKGGFLPIIENLLEAGANPNASNALHVAAYEGHTSVVNKLLDAGAGLDSSEEYKYDDRDGHLTALQGASRGGHIDVVKRLLELGANVHAIARDRGSTALQGATKSGSVQVVRCLLAAGADANEPAEDYQRTALQAAAEIGNLEMVNSLLNAGALLEREASESGQNHPALELAIKNAHVDVAHRLVDLVVGPSEETLPDHMHDPFELALRAAATGGYEMLVRRLMGISEVSKQEVNTLIARAANEGHTSLVQFFLDMIAESDDIKPAGLQSAVEGSHVDTVRLLLAHGADVNSTSRHSKPVLHVASRNGNVELVKMLEAGADIYATTYDGTTVAQSAAEGGNPEVTKLIEEATNEKPAPLELEQIVDLSVVEKKHLCKICEKGLPLALFKPSSTSPRPHGRYQGKCWHRSLITLRDSALQGCPFCMFFWKQLGISKISIPQPSVIYLFGSDGDSMRAQIDEPYPKDIERPLRLFADFHWCVEPFEGREARM